MDVIARWTSVTYALTAFLCFWQLTYQSVFLPTLIVLIGAVSLEFRYSDPQALGPSTNPRTPTLSPACLSHAFEKSRR